MSEHAFCDFSRANYPHEGDKNNIGAEMVRSTIRVWERIHGAKVLEFSMWHRTDLGEAVVELIFEKVEYM